MYVKLVTDRKDTFEGATASEVIRRVMNKYTPLPDPKQEYRVEDVPVWINEMAAKMQDSMMVRVPTDPIIFLVTLLNLGFIQSIEFLHVKPPYTAHVTAVPAPKGSWPV